MLSCLKYNTGILIIRTSTNFLHKDTSRNLTPEKWRTEPQITSNKGLICLRLKMINNFLITQVNFCSSFGPYLRLSLPKLINLHELIFSDKFPDSIALSTCYRLFPQKFWAVKKPKSSHAKGINRRFFLISFFSRACGKAKQNLFPVDFQAGPCGWLQRWLAWVIMTWFSTIYHPRNYILWGFFELEHVCGGLAVYLLSQFLMQCSRRISKQESRTHQVQLTDLTTHNASIMNWMAWRWKIEMFKKSFFRKLK